MPAEQKHQQNKNASRTKTPAEQRTSRTTRQQNNAPAEKRAGKQIGRQRNASVDKRITINNAPERKCIRQRKMHQHTKTHQQEQKRPAPVFFAGRNASTGTNATSTSFFAGRNAPRWKKPAPPPHLARNKKPSSRLAGFFWWPLDPKAPSQGPPGVFGRRKRQDV